MELFMKSKSWIFVCLLLLVNAYNIHAQTKDSLNRPEGIEVPQYQQKDSLAASDDTSLDKNSFSDSDSIVHKWKQSHEFAYMHYLDSLLRKQKDLKSDTVSINESTGKINRNHPLRRDVSTLNQVLNSLPLKIFFWTLALIFIGFISYKVLFKNGVFTRNKSKYSAEEEEESLHDLDDLLEYDALISVAENNNDFNLATRYLYLKTLKNLSERGFINFTPDKTNKEYLQEMSLNNYSGEFESLTRNYEYAWYGKFLIDANAYQQLKERFNLFNKKV